MLELIPKSQQIWTLVDCDSFYASCEIWRNPTLKGKPVVVCRNSDIVLAASYEAKRLWITTGTAARDAKKILWNKGIFIAPDMKYYRDVSERINTIILPYSHDCFVFSIDEAFYDITLYKNRNEGDYITLCKQIQDKVMQYTGVSVSLWVGKTKLQAKMLSKINKPYGICVALSQEKFISHFLNQDVDTIPFIAKGWTKRIQYNIKTVEDFIYAKHEYIKKVMWWSWLKIFYELNDINAWSPNISQKPYNIWRSKSFHPNFTKDKDILRSYLINNFDKAYNEMIELNAWCKIVWISLRDKAFLRYSYYIKLPNHTMNKKILLDICKEQFEKIFRNSLLYRTTGVFFGGLSYSTQKYWLFDKIEENEDKVSIIMKKLNNKYWNTIITSASNNIKKVLPELEVFNFAY